MTKAIAQINFLPVCSECGHVLYGETVSVDRATVILQSTSMADEKITTVPHRTVANREILISPWRCKYCGARFDAVIMPGKLPFESPQDCTNCFVADK